MDLPIQVAAMVSPNTDDVPITVYSLQTCSHCRAAKDFLARQAIPFRVILVDMLTGEARSQVLRRLKRLNPACSFPTIDVGGRIFIGFNRERLSAYLASLPGGT